MSFATELDSHADSPVVGANTHILFHTGKKVSVSGFTNELGKPLRVPVVHALVAYDCEYTGKTYLLLIHNALYFKKMEVNLIPPFMMRLAGLIVNECPKFLARRPTINNHTIQFPQEQLTIHLKIEGIISYLPTRKPSMEEVREQEGQYLAITPNSVEWDPHSSSYSEQEESMLNYRGELIERKQDQDRVWIGMVQSEEQPMQRVASVTNRSIIQGSLDADVLAESLKRRLDVNAEVKAVNVNGRYKGVSAKELSKVWNIPIEQARRTLEATTQYMIRTADVPSLTRRYKSNDRMLRYLRIRSKVFMDTMFASGKAARSVRGYKAAQVFATEFGHVFVVLITSKTEVPKAVKRYFKEIGVPPNLICDGAREQVRGDTLALCNDVGCQITELEKGTPASNRAERYIKMLKDETKRDMVRVRTPIKLWCYCLTRRAKIINCVARNNFELQGTVPHTRMTGQPCDISHLAEFRWYEWVKYRREGAKFPYPHERLGRILGPTDHAGTVISHWILTEDCEVLPLQTVRTLTESEIANADTQKEMVEFDNKVKERLGDEFTITEEGDKAQEDDVEVELERKYEEPNADDHIRDVDEYGNYDNFIHAEVLLPKDGKHMVTARVIGKAKDGDGLPQGSYNQNPILNTTIYDVMFPDGSVQQYAANTIAENLYNQVDEDGHRYQLLDSIIDHKRDSNAIDKQDGYVVNALGKRNRRKTTKGWSFHIQWKDGTRSWCPLRELKESNPVEIAEYVHSNGMMEEPAFAWWVPYTMKKAKRIIAAVCNRRKIRNKKFGIEVPRTVREALELDIKNGDTFWRNAIAREMKNVMVAFEILSNGETVPANHKYLDCHMIFDVKMDLTRKARFVANGAKTPDPESSTYAGVVSRETVRIALTYAALMELNVMAADIQNAYLQAPISERYWTICGAEFGTENVGKRALIVRALYGTKTAGRDFRNHLRDCMEHLGFTSCLADPDLWLRLGVDRNGRRYYEYVLLYVDDCLCISGYPEDVLRAIDKYFPMKPGSIGPPKIYLGAKIGQVQLPNGVKAYSISMSQYTQESIKNVEKYLSDRGLGLLRNATTPLTNGYHPEVDASEELGPEEATYYQSLIGILRWVVEMGRMDISTEVSMMSSFVAMPRKGHLSQLFHIFSYLKAHHNARVVFDPTYPEVDTEAFKVYKWEEKYGNIKEEIPLNAPVAYGVEFLIRAYVDASYAGCKVSRRSRTGFIVYLNQAPIYWLSKKQTSVESSTFGSKFVAMRTCCEYLKGLRYKLRMMGIPVCNPVYLYGDNQSVLWNTSVPDSVLKKKTQSVSYHYVREGVAKNEWRSGYVKTSHNPADVFTKSLPNGEDRKRKIRQLMYDIYPERPEE